jgi:parallel beta helix pectate lyase-like protein
MSTLLRISAFFVSLIFALPVLAAPRTFVASTGVDTNPCSLVAPCRSFARALTVTDANGEIIVLDSAGYGRVTIDRSVSIVAPPGIYAGISVFSGTNGVDINTAGVKVVLRGLTINGQGGVDGIRFVQGAELHVESCVISNMSFRGLNDTAPGSQLFVRDTIVRDNARGGIVVSGAFLNEASATIDRVRVERNGSPIGLFNDAGIAAGAAADVTVSNSVAANNFRGISGGGSAIANEGVTVMIENSIVTRNVVGLFVAGSGTGLSLMLSSNTNITFNSLFGIEQQSPGAAWSFGGNTVAGNGGGESFALTVPKQ